MKKQTTILRHVLALVMLLLFTFSITPKKYWHDLIADHSDYTSQLHSSEASVRHQGFNCHCEDLVVSVPYTESTIHQELSAVAHYNRFAPATYHFYYFSHHATKDLRGPPAAA